MKKIILLRHGEVDIQNYKNMSSIEFGEWIIEYNNADIKSDFLQKNDIKKLLNETDILICSTLRRSLLSLEIFKKMPFECNALFNEAEIPYSSFSFLRLKSKYWLIIYRILWFLGYAKNVESYKKTKIRAKEAAEHLIKLSKNNESVILVGHGIMNKFIQKELLLNKYLERKKTKNKNWDYSVFLFKK